MEPNAEEDDNLSKTSSNKEVRFTVTDEKLPADLNKNLERDSSITIDKDHSKLLDSYLKEDYGGGEDAEKFATNPYNCTSISIAIAVLMGVLGIVLEIASYIEDLEWDDIIEGEDNFPEVLKEHYFSGHQMWEIKMNTDNIKLVDPKLLEAINLLRRSELYDPIFLAMAGFYLVVLMVHLFLYCSYETWRNKIYLVDGIYILGGLLMMVLSTVLGVKVIYQDAEYIKASRLFLEYAHKYEAMKDNLQFKKDGYVSVPKFYLQTSVTEPPGFQDFKTEALYYSTICMTCASESPFLDTLEKQKVLPHKGEFLEIDNVTYTYDVLVKLGFCHTDGLRGCATILFLILALVCWALPCVACFSIKVPNAIETGKIVLDEAGLERKRRVSLEQGQGHIAVSPADKQTHVKTDDIQIKPDAEYPDGKVIVHGSVLNINAEMTNNDADFDIDIFNPSEVTLVPRSSDDWASMFRQKLRDIDKEKI